MIDTLFNEYREITINIIDELRTNDEVDLESLMDERTRVLEQIGSLNLDKDVVKKSYEKLDIASADKILEETILETMKDVKESIRKNQLLRDANRGYASSVRGSNIFSKKV